MEEKSLDCKVVLERRAGRELLKILRSLKDYFLAVPTKLRGSPNKAIEIFYYRYS